MASFVMRIKPVAEEKVKKSFSQIFSDLSMPILLVLLIIFFAIMSDKFFTGLNLTNILVQNVHTAVCTTGVFIIMVSGGCDLSIGYQMAVAAVLVAKAISTGSLLVVALLVGEGSISITLMALLGACLGFIPYNKNPAKIFMGDTGATFLGYILATLSIQGLFKMYAIISFAVPFLILGIPIFDICFAFLRRIAKGQNPMVADRGHVHHRLIDMGFNQKQAVAIAYMLTAILGLAAVLLTSSGELKALILIGAVFIVGAIGMRIIFKKPAQPPKPPETTTTEETAHEEN